MERFIRFPAFRTKSLDAWDQENLKYLRKFSQTSRPESINAFTTKNGLEPLNPTPIGPIRTDQEVSIEKEAEKSIGTEFEEEKSCAGLAENRMIPDSLESDEFRLDASEANVLDTYSTMAGSLDSCYLLDVVTVRNDSVLANHDTLRSKLRSGSDGYETGSSLESSIDEGSFFHSMGKVTEEGFSEESLMPPSLTSTVSERRISITMRPQTTCPYCGEVQSGNFFNRGLRNGRYFSEEAGTEDGGITTGCTSMPTGEDFQSSRSESPYYVRLRRDLNFPAWFSPQLSPPKNFGMDQQGQLLIDYTPNWNSLEKYIQNLKLCN